MKNLLSRLEKSLRHRRHPKVYRCHLETHPRHPEFISGSQESREMLKQVQHDDCVGWRRTSFSIGRSMTEMLGVLAIIGVLSLGGLYAYRQAMLRYKVNQVADMINRVEFAFEELCPDENNCVFGNWYFEWKNNASYLCNYGPDLCPVAPAQFYQMPYLPGVIWQMGRSAEFNTVLFIMYNLSPKMCRELVRRNWGSHFKYFEVKNFGSTADKDVAAKDCDKIGTDDSFIIFWKMSNT